MRHFICLRPALLTPAVHALGVSVATFEAVLIALCRLALQALARALCAVARAVALASVAVATDNDLHPAAGTQEQPGRPIAYDIDHGHPRQTGRCWTGAVLKCHNRRALVSNTVKGAAIGSNLPVRAAAAPAYFSVWTLLKRIAGRMSHADISPPPPPTRTLQ